MHAPPYDSISVNEVLAEADVGRATFYSHYRNKDDLLFQSVSVVLEVFADRYLDLLRGEGSLAGLESLLEHFRENRLLLRRIRSMARFAELIEERLAIHCRETGRAPVVAPAVAARTMADGLFGTVRAWIDGGAAPGSAAGLAKAMRSFAVSGTAALLAGTLPAD